ncbi:MAG: hypothetical protein JWO06_1799 [Bacteroidota bacterium]|nr:hypothetical protein [Bacteroidota bacterium]
MKTQMTLSTLNTLALVWIGVGVVAFPFLLKITQPYGRHVSEKWGPMIGNKLGWVLQEFPSLIFLTLFFLLGTGTKTKFAWFLWALWAIHYFNRSFIFPLRIKTKGKKIPLLIVGSAICFNFVNGFLNGTYLGNFGGTYSDDLFTSPRVIIGFLIFITGAFINNQSDTILINLRKPGETGYKIPVGGLFRFVSCPNLFGEMVEWLGFALIANSLPAWSFFIWTVVNLVPRALDHHKWYLQQFKNYPKERKAVWPFVL